MPNPFTRRQGRVLLLALPLLAAAPAGVDTNSAIARWVQGLKTPEGYLCCSTADCRPTAIGVDSDGVRWAWIGKEQFGVYGVDEWRAIPERVWQETQSDGDPPDGRAWVCFWGNAVKCAKSGGAG
jgi:hypothetical protein